MTTANDALKHLRADLGKRGSAYRASVWVELSQRVPDRSLDSPAWRSAPFCAAILQRDRLRNGQGMYPAALPYFVPSWRQAAQKAGTWRAGLAGIRPGDYVVMGHGEAHIGICEKPISNTAVQTLEGNTAPGPEGSQGNGLGTFRRTRYTSGSFPVLGHIRVTYSSGPSGPSWQTPAHMRAVQELLNEVIDAGLTVDGVRGPLTEAATREYQSARDAFGHTLTTDGSPGPATRSSLEATLSALQRIEKAVADLSTVTLSVADYRVIYGLDVDRPVKVSRDDVMRLSFRRIYETLREVRGGRTDNRAARAELAELRALVESLAK